MSDPIAAMIAARARAVRDEWLDELNPDEPGSDAATWTPEAVVQTVKDAVDYEPKPLQWTNGHLTHGKPWSVA